MSALSSRLVADAVVSPTLRLPTHPGRLLMGVHDAAGYVDGTVLDRRAGTTGAPLPPGLLPPPAGDPVPEAVYAGPLYFHFGHFLLESLARAWFAERHPDVPILWAGGHGWGERALKRWQRDILDVLGVTNPVVVASEPVAVTALHVPDIGYRYDDRFHPEHAAFLGRYDGPPRDPDERLWLSRSGLDSDARTLEAEPVERRLADAGWTVVRPEQLPIRAQLDHLARAGVVSGEEGSAFHLVALLRDVDGLRLRVLRRHGEEHPNMRTVGEARSIDQTFHTLHTEHVVKAKGRVVTKVNPNASEVLDLLEVPVPPPSAPTAPTAPAARSAGDADDAVLADAVARLAPDSLLEVGPAHPALALGAGAATRVAVNPRFADDPRAHAGSGVDFFELDLPRWVEHFHDGEQRFDVIRVTGPDLAAVIASFRASRTLGHARTSWLLGTGALAARAAVAVPVLHPAFAAERVDLDGRTLYVVRRTGRPARLDDFAALDDAAVADLAAGLPAGRVEGGATPDTATTTAGAAARRVLGRWGRA